VPKIIEDPYNWNKPKRIMIIVSEDISKAAEILNEENLVAIPTETVYGLAGIL
jgi:tRNA A37 threonylcarbamoyladenosine synthetase subunit TsaC/SUA5/YrdC